MKNPLYVFNLVTKQYLGYAIEAVVDINTSLPIQPSGTTFAEPPIPGVNEAVVFKGDEFKDGAWALVPDFRNVEYFEKATGKRVNLGLEEVPGDTITEIPPQIEGLPATYNDCIYWNEVSGAWELNVELGKQKAIAEVIRKARDFLGSTDWKVTKHLGQKKLVESALIPSTSITEEDYVILEAERQRMRDLTNFSEYRISYIVDSPTLFATVQFLDPINNDNVPTQAEVDAFASQWEAPATPMDPDTLTEV